MISAARVALRQLLCCSWEDVRSASSDAPCCVPSHPSRSANPATWMLDVTTPAVEAATGGDFAEHFGELACCPVLLRKVRWMADADTVHMAGGLLAGVLLSATCVHPYPSLLQRCLLWRRLPMRKWLSCRCLGRERPTCAWQTWRPPASWCRRVVHVLSVFGGAIAGAHGAVPVACCAAVHASLLLLLHPCD